MQQNLYTILNDEQLSFIYDTLQHKYFFSFVYDKIQNYRREELQINNQDDKTTEFNKFMFNNKIFDIFILQKIKEINYIEYVHLLNKLLTLLSTYFEQN